jgi:hypothetical protein
MNRSVIASGTVRVRDLRSGAEWDEIVEVFDRDMEDTDGTMLCVEDVARRVAVNQASPADVETLGVDVS